MRLFTLKALLLLPLSTFCQPNDDARIFANAHGLVSGTSMYFEVEGYEVFTYDFEKRYFDEKGIKKAKRRFDVKKSNTGGTDSTLVFEHRYFVTEDEVSGLIQKNVYYFLPMGDNRIKAIGFSTLMERNKEVERLFVKSILDESIPESVFTSVEVDSIPFAGRYIQLGPVCRWMGPHNMQCPDLGQISWSSFRTMTQARRSAEISRRVTAGRGMGKILEKDSVDVIFEGIETKALRTVYKIKLPRLVMGGSNVLVIYYVAEEVRGTNVACIMSHYIDQAKEGELPPLIGEVMELVK